MSEVLVANKGMVILLLSHLGWSYFLHVFLGLRPMYRLMYFYPTLFVRLVFGFLLTSWCARFVGVVSRTPRLRYIVISV